MRRQKGVALLLVLWALALLSLLLSGLASLVQLETRQASWARQNTQALLAAEAGLAMAVQGLNDPKQRHVWIADGRQIALRFDEAQLRVSLRSERGKLDLNSAAVDDIARLAQACGASNNQAASMAQALEKLRGSGSTLLRVFEEVRQLPGITMALYKRLLPEVTLWSGLERPEPAFASPLLKKALNLPNQTAAGNDPGDVLTIESSARLPSGAYAELHATTLLSPSEESAQPYRVLRWQE